MEGNEENPRPRPRLRTVKPAGSERWISTQSGNYGQKPIMPTGNLTGSYIYPYYHPDIVFQDSIQRIEGIDEFKALCGRLTQRCESLQMEILAITQDANVILMDWIMTMAFREFPPTPVYGSTKLTLHEDGRMIAERDYFDMWATSSTGSRISRSAIAGLCAKSSGEGRRMPKSKLPDELIFIANRRASQKTTNASMAGKVCVVSVEPRAWGWQPSASCPRQRPHRHGLPDTDKAEIVRQEDRAQLQRAG